MSAVLFYTIGLPGAGKTTFASSLGYWLGIDHLRGDKLGLELFRFPTFSAPERQAVYAEMARRTAVNLQAGRNVLYDAAVNTREQRRQLAGLAEQNGGQAIGIWVQTPLALAKQRAGMVRDRGIAGPIARIIPPHIFDQYLAAFEVPAENERVVLVSGDANFALQYRRLQRQLRSHHISLPAHI